MPDALKGRQIVLAGGTGGLGSVTANLLAAERAELFISGIGEDAPIRADLTIAADRRRLLDAAPRMYGLVVLTGDPARIADPEEAMRRSHEVNYLGPVLLARAAAERMKAAGTQGAIVLFGTMQAVSVFTGSTAYASQKAALIAAARILAKECRGPANIRVNVICPGVTEAGMARASIAAGKYERYLRDGVIHRYGSAEDIARAVRFFLEPDNYITGQVLTIDGGLTL